MYKPNRIVVLWISVIIGIMLAMAVDVLHSDVRQGVMPKAVLWAIYPVIALCLMAASWSVNDKD